MWGNYFNLFSWFYVVMRDLGMAFYRKGDEKYLGYNKKIAS